MMALSKVQALYDQQIRPLSREDRLRLLALVQGDLDPKVFGQSPVRSLLELEGLGAELWQGVDTQEYVDALRAKWTERP